MGHKKFANDYNNNRLQFPSRSFATRCEGSKLYGSDQEGNGSYAGRYCQVV